MSLAEKKDPSDEFYIPTKPEIVTKIQRIISGKFPDIEGIANLVASDIGLSAAVLKTINSPFYGMLRVIGDIKQASR